MTALATVVGRYSTSSGQIIGKAMWASKIRDGPNNPF